MIVDPKRASILTLIGCLYYRIRANFAVTGDTDRYFCWTPGEGVDQQIFWIGSKIKGIRLSNETA